MSCIARRTRIPVELIPTDPRARKLRTIDKDQLALALAGKIDHVYGYSFILTNLDVSTPARLVAVEHWYRHRTDIEALNRDAKHGAALRHLPSGDRTVNTVWMWAALLACAISNWIQELTGIDNGRGRVRRRWPGCAANCSTSRPGSSAPTGPRPCDHHPGPGCSPSSSTGCRTYPPPEPADLPPTPIPDNQGPRTQPPAHPPAGQCRARLNHCEPRTRKTVHITQIATRARTRPSPSPLYLGQTH